MTQKPLSLKTLKENWTGRPAWLISLHDQTDFKSKNRRAWCAYMRLLIAARDLTAALEEPKKGCQCNAHVGTGQG